MIFGKLFFPPRCSHGYVNPDQSLMQPKQYWAEVDRLYPGALDYDSRQGELFSPVPYLKEAV